MTLELLTIDINKHAESHFIVLNINNWHLFYIEWDYDKEVEIIELMGFRV